jgi:hypothetical protein
MSAEDLKAQFDAACLAGDYATQERLGPLVHPEPGASPPAPSPSADPARDSQKLSATEFARQQRELYTAMEQTHPGSPRMKELEASLETLLKTQHGVEPARPAGADEAFTLADQVSFPAGTAEPVRVGLLSLAALDDVPVPMIQSAIREISQARPMSPDAARRELEAEFGDRLPTVLRIADEVHLTLPPGLQAGIEAQELFSSPILVKHMLALRAWRQGGRGRG